MREGRRNESQSIWCFSSCVTHTHTWRCRLWSTYLDESIEKKILSWRIQFFFLFLKTVWSFFSYALKSWQLILYHCKDENVCVCVCVCVCEPNKTQAERQAALPLAETVGWSQLNVVSSEVSSSRLWVASFYQHMFVLYEPFFSSRDRSCLFYLQRKTLCVCVCVYWSSSLAIQRPSFASSLSNFLLFIIKYCSLFWYCVKSRDYIYSNMSLELYPMETAAPSCTLKLMFVFKMHQMNSLSGMTHTKKAQTVVASSENCK